MWNVCAMLNHTRPAHAHEIALTLSFAQSVLIPTFLNFYPLKHKMVISFLE